MRPSAIKAIKIAKPHIFRNLPSDSLWKNSKNKMPKKHKKEGDRGIKRKRVKRNKNQKLKRKTLSKFCLRSLSGKRVYNLKM